MRGSGRPIWDDIARAEDLAALAPPRPKALPSRVDVLVVGGGVVGLAVAAFCTRAGMDVLLVEREERLASCASGRAAGGLSPDAHPELGQRWRELARRSLALHRELDAQWECGLRTVDIRVGGNLVIGGQAHVDPLRFAAALARRTRTISVGTSYEESTSVKANHVVFATGAAPEDAGITAQSWVKGHLLATEPAPQCVDGFLAPVGVDVLVLQLPTGHILAGGTKEPGIDSAHVDDAVIARIAEAMGGMVPEAANLAITNRWTCFRPLWSDGLPMVRRLSENAWFAAGLYSTGVLMAPMIGQTMAQAISDGLDPEFDVDPVRK
jgi:glycine/D-amino acid oxidase-like deaminating enzyme